MARRRMFSNDIVGTDKFMSMSTKAQLLYFRLGLHADDDGIVPSPSTELHCIHAGMKHVQELVDKGYIVVFDSGVYGICDWKTNNYLRPDRHTSTKFTDEKLILDKISVGLMPVPGIPCPAKWLP